MEDPHEEGEDAVEDNPSRQEISRAYPRFRETHGGEEEGDRGQEEARFLVGD